MPLHLLKAADLITRPITVIVGHYGVGKTNLSLNLAIDLAATSQQVMLVDLDVVNPYFRSSDHKESLATDQVELIAPTFAGTTLDTPALPPEIAAAFQHVGPVIFDVGGDDVGATALGVYHDQLQRFAEAGELAFYYVVNRNRNLTETAHDAVSVAREIEATTRLALTGVINNSHLVDETDLSTIAHGYRFAREAAAEMELPLVATTLPITLTPAAQAAPEFIEASEDAAFYPVTRLVLPPWEQNVLDAR
ncbi:MAG: ParA family protein [Coriobacteriia bacterium]|nr:ParA family protein [Coriobacteriia bacterium]